MINLLSEELLTLGQAARVRPPGRRGRPTHRSTVARWIARGLRGCRLEALRLGGTLYTTREALQRFAADLTAATDSSPPTSPARRRPARDAE
jgi:Protein of unknown function (DUF1580)